MARFKCNNRLAAAAAQLGPGKLLMRRRRGLQVQLIVGGFVALIGSRRRRTRKKTRADNAPSQSRRVKPSLRNNSRADNKNRLLRIPHPIVSLRLTTVTKEGMILIWSQIGL